MMKTNRKLIVCFLSFALTSAICLGISTWFVWIQKGLWIMFWAVTAELGGCIWKKAPIENENRPITSEERRIKNVYLLCHESLMPNLQKLL